ncbi:MAG TPA: class I SAM-dependent methyltransferase [Acidimicrobiales bacterium]|nr:class I SAM-dependent methyltransferase [Acidimicrobiales bacterium]
MDTGWRATFWEYYDRRAAEGVRGSGHAADYWTGLGVPATAADIEAEARQLQRLLRALPPARFVELGAGPGTFTADLPGEGVAIDQSGAALRVLRTNQPRVPVVRADALRLPFPDKALDRAVAAHLYGVLPPEERRPLLGEARRVAAELVVVDAGRPDGVPGEHWQDRTLPDGGRYRILRRHFTGEQLAGELGGRSLFSGRFYVLVIA